MVANGVSIYPGAYFLCPEPGWFRIIFAMDTEVLQLGELQLCSNRGAKEGGAAEGKGGEEVLKGLRSSRDQLNRHQEVDSPPTNNSEITETV